MKIKNLKFQNIIFPVTRIKKAKYNTGKSFQDILKRKMKEGYNA